jgi:hypothetical protein
MEVRPNRTLALTNGARQDMPSSSFLALFVEITVENYKNALCLYEKGRYVYFK